VVVGLGVVVVLGSEQGVHHVDGVGSRPLRQHELDEPLPALQRAVGAVVPELRRQHRGECLAVVRVDGLVVPPDQPGVAHT